MSVYLRVRDVTGGRATMEDGRVVRLGPLSGISRGDYLEVYADLALSKSDPIQVSKVRSARMEVSR